MFTYLYAVEYYQREYIDRQRKYIEYENKIEDKYLMLIIESEKKIPKNTIEARIGNILSMAGIKDIYYISFYKEITVNDLDENGLLKLVNGYEYLKCVIRKRDDGKYQIEHFLNPNLDILNILHEKKLLNIYYYYGGYGQYQSYCYGKDVLKDFSKLYFIKNTVANKFTLKNEKDQLDYESLKSIVKAHNDIQYVMLLPSFLDINELDSILKLFYDCSNFDTYVIDINMKKNIFRKASLEGNEIRLREVFLS